MKLSIIIPVYNEENCIGDAIKSLLKQTEKDFEIIIVDDGSTDKTKEVVKKLMEKSKKVNLIFGEHKGPGFSRNLGAKKAKGDFLVFVDADMTFEKNYLKNLVLPMEKNDSIIGTSHSYEVAVNTNNWISEMWGKIRVDDKEGYGIRAVIFRAIRREKFLELGGFNPKYGYADDQTFYLERNLRPYVSKNTLCYHRNPESLKETFKQSRWIGASWKERFWFFRVPFLNYFVVLFFFLISPFSILLKASAYKKNPKISFINRVHFFKNKIYGNLFGIARSVYLGKVWK